MASIVDVRLEKSIEISILSMGEKASLIWVSQCGLVPRNSLIDYCSVTAGTCHAPCETDMELQPFV